MRDAVISTIFALGIFLLLALFAVIYFILQRPQKNLKTAELKIGGNIFAVEVASTTVSRARGLSGREGLGENEGMLFIFDGFDNYGFWMKNMKFSIDIIWIKNDRVAGLSERVAPEPGTPPWKLKIYYPPEPVNRVLEVAAGTVEKRRIKVGDEVSFSTGE